MARFARAVAGGVAHHTTQRGVDRQRVFFTDADRRKHLECLATYSAQARARILAFCLMDNRIHLVAVPEEPRSLAVALRRAHGRYSLYLNARRNRAGHLWQNRFYSCPLDQRHLWIALRYVERNPVRAELGGAAGTLRLIQRRCPSGDGPHSQVPGLVLPSGGGRPRRLAGLLAEPEALIGIRALQRGTFTGQAVGEPDFIARLEEQLDPPLALRQGQRTPCRLGAMTS